MVCSIFEVNEWKTEKDKWWRASCDSVSLTHYVSEFGFGSPSNEKWECSQMETTGERGIDGTENWSVILLLRKKWTEQEENKMKRFTVQVLLLVFIFQESGENVFLWHRETSGIQSSCMFDEKVMCYWCVCLTNMAWCHYFDWRLKAMCRASDVSDSVSWRRDCEVSARNRMLFVINNQQGRHRIYDSWLSTLMRRMNCLLVVVVLFLLGCCHLRWKWNWW